MALDPEQEALKIFNAQAIGIPSPAGVPPTVINKSNPVRDRMEDDQLMKLAKAGVLRRLTEKEMKKTKKSVR